MRLEDIEKMLFPWQLEEFKRITKIKDGVEKAYRDQNEAIQNGSTIAARLAAEAMSAVNLKATASLGNPPSINWQAQTVYGIPFEDIFRLKAERGELSALRADIDKAFDTKHPCDDAKRINFAKVIYKNACDYESIELSDFVHKMSNLLGTDETNYKLFFKSCLEIVKGEVKDAKELSKKLEKKTEEVEQLQITLKLCDQKKINVANEMYARIKRDGLLNFIKSSL